MLAIAAGGAGGALLRYWMTAWVALLLGRDFPWGTLAVNLLGSASMGFMAEILVERLGVPLWVRQGLLVGFLGALTTFSTFAFDTLRLLEFGHLARAMANAVGSMVVCMAAIWLGQMAARGLLAGFDRGMGATPYPVGLVLVSALLSFLMALVVAVLTRRVSPELQVQGVVAALVLGVAASGSMLAMIYGWKQPDGLSESRYLAASGVHALSGLLAAAAGFALGRQLGAALDS